MSPDLAARRLLMSAYLYYVLASPVLSDGDYDALSPLVNSGWDQIAPIRQWQVGSKEEIKFTGHHVKVTWATIGGAHSWAGMIPPPPCPLQDWQWNEEHRVFYSGLV